MNNSQQRELQELIVEWQEPLYNLALRMLGNIADAADATQEICVALVRGYARYDRRRPLKPWIYRIANNTIFNMRRNSLHRRRRERSVPAPASTPEADAERRREVQEQLLQLSAEDRSLLVLRYYSGLSQTELASTLELPRTTLQARLQRALQNLKQRLTVVGSPAAALLEGTMTGTPVVPVPAELSAHLMKLASGAASLPLAVSSASLGGMVVAKKAIAGLILLALVCAAGGFWAGQRSDPRDADARMATSRAASIGVIEVSAFEELQRENQQLAQELQQLRSAADRQEHESRSGALPLEDAVAGSVAESSEEAADSDATGVADNGFPVDFRRLSELFAERLDLMTVMEGEVDSEPMTPEQKAQMMELYQELLHVAAEGRKVVEKPILDGRFFAGLMDALCTKTLGLAADQQLALLTLSGQLAAHHFAPSEYGDRLPAEEFMARVLAAQGIRDGLKPVLSGRQQDRFGDVYEITEGLMAGDRTEVGIGVQPDSDPEALRDQVLEHWQKAYQLDQPTPAAAQWIADAYIADVRRVLARYQQDQAEAQELTPVQQMRMREELWGLQVQRERELWLQATEAQRRHLARTTPVLFDFHRGEGNSISKRAGSPF